MQPCLYVPKGARKVTDKATGATVYTYERDGRLLAIAYAPNAKRKPDWHFRFGNTEQRERRIRAHFAGYQARAARTAERKAERSKPHNLQVGHVLVASWGYEQTNIDFYQVTAVPGPHTVELRPIGKISKAIAWAQEKVMPDIDRFTGEAIRRRVNPYGGVKIHSSATAYVWRGTAEHQTSYA